MKCPHVENLKLNTHLDRYSQKSHQIIILLYIIGFSSGTFAFIVFHYYRFGIILPLHIFVSFFFFFYLLLYMLNATHLPGNILQVRSKRTSRFKVKVDDDYQITDLFDGLCYSFCQQEHFQKILCVCVAYIYHFYWCIFSHFDFSIGFFFTLFLIHFR